MVQETVTPQLCAFSEISNKFDNELRELGIIADDLFICKQRIYAEDYPVSEVDPTDERGIGHVEKLMSNLEKLSHIKYFLKSTSESLNRLV